MNFSQRLGITPIEKLAQRESIDEDLKNSLWSAISLVYFERVKFNQGSWNETKNCNLSNLFTSLWLHFFKKPIDTIPHSFSTTVANLREYFFSCQWHHVFDLIEAIAKLGPKNIKKDFIDICNSYLERENSAYRFINEELTEITSEEEIKAVEEALTISFPGVNQHLKSALSLMSDRQNPDFRNSIKESISAVESLAKTLTGNDKATLGQALKVLEKNGTLHEALKSAFSALYGYTNDANGIRHALMQESTLGKADAKFMLVSCSCFINYLLEVSSANNE